MEASQHCCVGGEIALVGERGHVRVAAGLKASLLNKQYSSPLRKQTLKLKAFASTVKVAEPSELSTKETLLDIDPAFYEIGYVRQLRAYGIDFKEGRDGVGVYAAKDFPFSPKPRILMEIPLELMISISKDPPWIFHPDFVPWGHPIFDIINSTATKEDWDLRLACLLLFAMDTKGHFLQLYSDFLPEVSECSSLLLATEGELSDLQDSKTASALMEQQKRVQDFWKKHWSPQAPLKIRRLAPTYEHFVWAVAIAQTRHCTLNMTVGARPQVANMFVPYLDMLNHSVKPTCSLRWRRKDRMLEVLLNGRQSVKAGTEMTLNYMEKAENKEYVKTFGLSSPENDWEHLDFSGNARIHRDSFLSAFHIGGLPDEYFFYDHASQSGDEFLDGNLLAVARNLPFWAEGDLPFLPSIEKAAVKELQEECFQLLKSYPTSLERDLELLGIRSSIFFFLLCFLGSFSKNVHLWAYLHSLTTLSQLVLELDPHVQVSMFFLSCF
ncbi:hypothetical protein KP509_04G027900 [Ceratopteris richardii]|uniref:SET domain-containing protein n=1 Tax=Ceratopteris richardii TaxID=49495 RepID=A0A8T2V3B8_CERRI|nr:hypothetical protein KP509_04G027900 [Ceratopteris richardii]